MTVPAVFCAPKDHSYTEPDSTKLKGVGLASDLNTSIAEGFGGKEMKGRRLEEFVMTVTYISTTDKNVVPTKPSPYKQPGVDS
jgi:hypothetical protein